MNSPHSRFGSGQSVPRIEDDALLQCRGRFTDDITDDGAYADHVRLCFVRSPYPHVWDHAASWLGALPPTGQGVPLI